MVEYDGTDYMGFQRQSHGPSIAGALEDAARTIGAPSPVAACAGRTDSGVHARGQVVTMDLPQRIEERRIALAMNSVLPAAIRVRRAVLCGNDFDPRRDAVGRVYVYRLCAGTQVPPMFRNAIAHTRHVLSPSLAAEAAACFVGKHEFRAWRSSHCEATRTHLTIRSFHVIPPQPPEESAPLPPRPWFELVVEARSFLHHMVRFLTGGIIAVATGRLSTEELRAALAEGTRPECVVMAEARGLTLEAVQYPPERDPFLSGFHP